MDRFSNLPDSLLHHILSFMPMQDVVKTSLLSKRLDGLWISLPYLVMDLYSFSDHNRFVDFVNKCLIFRGSNKVKRFTIKLFLGGRYYYTRDLDLWIRYALQNDVEELFLDLSGDQAFYRPPQFLCRCSSIRILLLSMCKMSLASEISWPLLKSLTHKFLHLRGEVIQKVLLGCPALESLEVLYCFGFDGLSTNSTCLKKLIICLNFPDDEDYEKPLLTISAPNLTYLHLSGILYRKCLMVDMSSLVHASVDLKANLFDIDGLEYHQELLLEVLGSLAHVEKLTLGAWCVKVLAIKEKKDLPSPPSKRKCLTLVSPIKQEDLLGILHLLKYSPNLEKLVLDMTANPQLNLLFDSKLRGFLGFCNFDEENYMASQVDNLCCSVEHLKIVKIGKFVEQTSAFLLIEFLLKKAKVLETMVIRAQKVASSSTDFFHAAQKLLAMPRLSSGATVLLLE